MDLETWVSIGSLIGVGLGLYAAMRGFRTELKTDISGLRAELKDDISNLRTVVDRLDDRVYVLATHRSPGPLIVPRTRD